MLNIKMMRIRRYRIFFVFAVIVLLVLLRLNHSKLESASKFYQSYKSQDQKHDSQPWIKHSSNGFQEEKWQSHIDVEDTVHPTTGVEQETIGNKKVVNDESSSIAIPTRTIPTVPAMMIPDRKPISGLHDDEETDTIHAQPPGKVWPFQATGSDEPIPTVYWEKQKEHFPVESMIQLPTGKPKIIPKIQFAFQDESPEARATRQKRQEVVRIEFQHAWNGYKEKAWGHDELTPVSGRFADPFAGWSATLVDSLDSLYIFGFEAEFEQAVKQTSEIDFKTANRNDIPVFETTIRYMGGLLAAYDVSGGKYGVLLEKAKELGEVLLGAFDSPNRMPELYYKWKPAFASQPHRASQRSSLAELGSLSMEFTRLAQLTEDSRFYDAVARITDALYEWQENNGTALSGLFPMDVDASGCNRTATDEKLKLPPLNHIPSTNAQGYEAPMLGNPREPTKHTYGDSGDLELSIVPGLPGEPAKGRIATVSDDDSSHDKRQISKNVGLATDDYRAHEDEVYSVKPPHPVPNDPPTPSKAALYEHSRLAGGTRRVENWDCVPQGLAASMHSRQTYSMGGGQDSTYEYFTKQYLLLGGLEPKYEKLYRQTIDGIKKNLLYRPMIPDSDRKILFSGKITIVEGILGDIPTVGFDAEVTHLTCFLGGMVGMGAMVFELSADIEIAKALSDGCVWAYEATESGIMPEDAVVIPCDSFINCAWNETLWEHHIDPIWDRRDQMIVDYDENKARVAKQQLLMVVEDSDRFLEAEKNFNMIAETKKLEDKERNDRTAHRYDRVQQDQNHIDLEEWSRQDIQTSTENLSSELKNAKINPKTDTVGPDAFHDAASALSAVWEESEPVTDAIDIDVDSKAPPSTRGSITTTSPSLQNRDLSLLADDSASPRAEIPKPITHDMRFDQRESKSTGLSIGLSENDPRKNSLAPSSLAEVPAHDAQEIKLYEKLRQTEEELNTTQPSTGSKRTGSASTTDTAFSENHDSFRPLSHKQWVAEQLRSNLYPKGYSSIKSNRYILRPEAIESVWYMYRITGDTIWQEKGWVMFCAIIEATKTEFGHSSLEYITREKPSWSDGMESFWLAETLKYFYLLFSEPSVISLDEWVLNTEAHPFRRSLA